MNSRFFNKFAPLVTLISRFPKPLGFTLSSLPILRMANEEEPKRSSQNPNEKREDEEREDSWFSPGFETTDITIRRKGKRKSPASVVIPVLDLDEATKKLTKERETRIDIVKENKEKKVENVQEIKKCKQGASISCSSSSFPCIDRLREELSCAICLEICFEPSTTPCGHSFCMQCLRSAADKCGKKCPKCRQLISKGRSCTVNTVLWNTIQLLFPKEIETRKELANSKTTREPENNKTPAKRTGPGVVGPTPLVRRSYDNASNRSIEALNSPENDGEVIPIERISRRENMRGMVASQDDNDELTFGLFDFDEEFMGFDD